MNNKNGKNISVKNIKFLAKIIFLLKRKSSKTRKRKISKKMKQKKYMQYMAPTIFQHILNITKQTKAKI